MESQLLLLSSHKSDSAVSEELPGKESAQKNGLAEDLLFCSTVALTDYAPQPLIK